MGKREYRNPTQHETQFGLLISYQAAARALGLTKPDVADMVSEGLLREVKAGSKRCITARSIIHTLGYDPFGTAAIQLLGTKYSKLTFEQYAVKLLNGGIRKAKSRSINNYRCGLSMAASMLGGLPVAEISEEDLRRAFKKLAAQYAKSSLKLAYQATRILFRQAFDSGDIPNDPTVKWELPKSTKPMKHQRDHIYTSDQIAAILQASKTFDQELYTMFAVLECTGMRPGEMLGLEWSSFDAKEKTIHIYQTVTFEFGTIQTLGKAAHRRSVLSVPKSEYSVRTLCLSDTATEALLAWRKALRSQNRSDRSHSAFIFPGKSGKFLTLSGAEKRLQLFRKAYSLEDVTFYKFRHTMCTRLVLAGQPLSIIQRIMGDNSSDVVTRVYTHVGADHALCAMRRYLNARDDDAAQALSE